ncbi:uncharacterized protein LOC126253092 [Schistocerca nitens]|uniref:uncharacterized protein LOC126253092 n=1 Tax=Schistocerca nitens TaxID=7011 RepID=UPI0021188D5C|nr:uncharacterized protein LOC126253092 [Schistocerca nitens]
MRAHTPLVLAAAFAVIAAVCTHASAANLREYCSSKSDCAAIQYANCTDNKCVCGPGYFPNYNGTACHHRSEAYEAPCRDTAECQQVLGNKSICQKRLIGNDTTERCLCLMSNHYDRQNHTCQKSLRLNDKCTGGVEGVCYLELDGANQHVRCASNGTCACEDGYVPDYLVMRCNSAPRLEWLSLSCLLGLLAVALAS